VYRKRACSARHARLGEVPCAEVVVDRSDVDPRALAAACARELSSHKVPVEIRVVDALPKTPGGKILRQAVAFSPRPG
jgi:rifamycin polyketide synthase module 1/2/3